MWPSTIIWSRVRSGARPAIPSSGGDRTRHSITLLFDRRRLTDTSTPAAIVTPTGTRSPVRTMEHVTGDSHYLKTPGGEVYPFRASCGDRQIGTSNDEWRPTASMVALTCYAPNRDISGDYRIRAVQRSDEPRTRYRTSVLFIFAWRRIRDQPYGVPTSNYNVERLDHCSNARSNRTDGYTEPPVA